MPGGTYNPSSGFGNNYGNRNPYEGGQVNGPYPGSGIAGAFGGMGNGMGFPPDLEGKSSLILPLAGAALLGWANLCNDHEISVKYFLDRNCSLRFGGQSRNRDGTDDGQASKAFAF